MQQFGRENSCHPLARCVCAFLYQHYFTKIILPIVVMTNMVNNLILVKKYTLWQRKKHHTTIQYIKKGCSFPQKATFAFLSQTSTLFPSPLSLVKVFVGSLDPCFLTHTKNHMRMRNHTYIYTCHIVQKHVRVKMLFVKYSL